MDEDDCWSSLFMRKSHPASMSKVLEMEGKGEGGRGCERWKNRLDLGSGVGKKNVD